MESPELCELLEEFLASRLGDDTVVVHIVLEPCFTVVARICGHPVVEALRGSDPRSVTREGRQLVLEDGAGPDPVENCVVPDDSGRRGNAEVAPSQVSGPVGGTLVSSKCLFSGLRVR